MAFPITVDPLSLTPEQPAKNGPFRNGTDRYMINISDDGAGTQTLTAWKSTDNGDTWAEQDAGNGPNTYSQLYSCCTGGGKIWCVYVDFSSADYDAVGFDPATDTWGIPSAPTHPPSAPVPVGIAAVYRTADASVALILPGNRVGTDAIHSIVSFNLFDTAGGTWGAWADLDYLDYVNPLGMLTAWQQVPCGACLDSDGNIRVFMAQVADKGNTQPVVNGYSSDDTFTVPGDCISIDVEVWGAGGGGGAVGPGGGGGGGGYSAVAGVPVLPGDLIAITVGVGGAQGVDGGDTTCSGATGGGGKAGGSPGQADGGAGGGNGGNGGAAGVGGGGGGAAGSSTGAGGNGGDGNNPPFGGGQGGVGLPGAGAGGAGGNTAVPPVEGADGSGPGGGGGGSGLGVTPGTGNGAAGGVIISYIPNLGTQAGRLWQQMILPDNSLGTLDQLPYTIPILDVGAVAIPVPFDCAAGTGFVAIAVTGVSTVGYDSIALGQGLNADPVVFAFTELSAGNAGSGLDSSPAVAVNILNGDVYLVYKSLIDPATVTFRYRKNSGAAVDLGSFADPGCRIMAAIHSGVLQMAFGTPPVQSVGTLTVPS